MKHINKIRPLVDIVTIPFQMTAAIEASGTYTVRSMEISFFDSNGQTGLIILTRVQKAAPSE